MLHMARNIYNMYVLPKKFGPTSKGTDRKCLRKNPQWEIEINEIDRYLAIINEEKVPNQAGEKKAERRLNLEQTEIIKLMSRLLRYQFQLQMTNKLYKQLKAAQKTLQTEFPALKKAGGDAMKQCPPKGKNSQGEDQCKSKETPFRIFQWSFFE